MSSDTLFVLLFALLVHRTLDLIAAKRKLDQLAYRLPRVLPMKLSFGSRRALRKKLGVEARRFFRRVCAYSIARTRFLDGVMVAFLLMITMIGLLTIAFPASLSNAEVLAIATLFFSILVSMANALVESVKNYLDRLEFVSRPASSRVGSFF